MRTEAQIQHTLQNLNCTIEPCRQEDEAALYAIYQQVIDEGSGFPYEDNSEQEFRRHFFSPGSRVFVCRTQTGEVLGGFFLKPNIPGRSSHIANAAYMMAAQARGQGLGRLLCEASLYLAKQLGFKAIQYNMVFSDNLRAIHLYTSLGFHIVAKLPNAIRNPDNTYQTGYIMFRQLP